MKPQKSFAHYDLVALAQDLRRSWQKAAPTIYKCSIGRTQILDHIDIVTKQDTGVAPGNFGIRIMCIQIDLRKNTVISIPPADVGFFGGKSEFRFSRCSAFNDQMSVAAFYLSILFIRKFH